jgi:hypothetical protein
MQKMSGRSSTPLAKSNAPVSIFAKEGREPVGPDTVTAKAGKGVPTPATPAKATPAPRLAPTAATPPVPTGTAKAPKAPAVAPKGKALEDVDATQAKRVDNGIARLFARKAQALVASGMTPSAAVDKVLAAVSTDTADALVELEGTTGTPASGLTRHFFNRTRARLPAGQEPADAIAGAFAAYPALVTAELAKLPAKAEKPAKPAKAEKPAK